MSLKGVFKGVLREFIESFIGFGHGSEVEISQLRGLKVLGLRRLPAWV